MKRNKFSLSHYKLLSMSMGRLIPLTWYEALPGDTLQQATAALIRCSPLLSPVMHPVQVRIHHWFVPNRLIWQDWENFITGGDDGKFLAEQPKIEIPANVNSGSIWDYLGIPPGDYSGKSFSFSALPLRAYQLIFNEYYRDQDLINERPVAVTSGPDTTTYNSLNNVAWSKDYYSSARPFESKGEEILIPLANDAPIKGFGLTTPTFGSSGALKEAGGKDTGGNYETYQTYGVREDSDHPGYPGIYADLSQATGISINDLRDALARQRYQEARARFGSRYSEYLRYIVGPGYNPPDARLQEPEYLGGGRTTIAFSEVLGTNQNDEVEPQGNPLGQLGGHGIAAMRSRRFRRFIPEHGIVMTMMSVLPKAIYMQELHKKWSRLTKEDYFQKELQFIGEQPVQNIEAYSLHSDPKGTFGFANRFDEYRSHPSGVAGEFNDTLNYWHYGRDFQSEPALNESFITANPTKRTHASTDTDTLYVMANHSIQARRILAKYGKPRTF